MRRLTGGFLSILFCLVGTARGNTAVPPTHIFAKNKNTIVRIIVNGSFSGCGFVVSEDGLVATDYHVIATAESQFTQIASGKIEVQQRQHKEPYRSYPAVIVDSSPLTDTALIRTIAIGLPKVSIRKRPPLPIGTQSTTVTCLPNSDSESLESGLITGAGTISQDRLNAKIIVSRIPVRKGYSGSPMFDEHGRVIGVMDTHVSEVPTAASGKTSDADLLNGFGEFLAISYTLEKVQKEQKFRSSQKGQETPTILEFPFP